MAFINENDKLLTMDDCRIRDAIIELRAKLLVIDPIQAYIGNDGDLNNASKARKILQTLSHWAAAFGCAVVLVGHLNKRDNGKELYRSLGSIDVVASARSVLQVHRSEDDPNIRVLHHVKSSLAPRGKDAYFQIAEKGAVLWQDDCKDMVSDTEKNQGTVPDKEENKQDVVCAACDLSNTFTLNGYEIVRSQLFSTREKPQLTIAKGQVRFNSVCLKKFESVEYVELLFNSVEKCLAVRPCAADKPTAIQWGRLKDSRWIVSTKSCSGFSGALYSVMDWKADCGYKLCGQYISDGNEQMLLFDLSDPEITEFEKDTVVKTMKSNDGKETKKEKIVYHRNTVIPDSWKNCFGRNSNIIRFEFIHDKNNWEVMRPASVFRMCGNITDNIMQRVHSEIDTLTTEFLKETERKLVADGKLY